MGVVEPREHSSLSESENRAQKKRGKALEFREPLQLIPPPEWIPPMDLNAEQPLPPPIEDREPPSYHDESENFLDCEGGELPGEIMDVPMLSETGVYGWAGWCTHFEGRVVESERSVRRLKRRSREQLTEVFEQAKRVDVSDRTLILNMETRLQEKIFEHVQQT